SAARSRGAPRGDEPAGGAAASCSTGGAASARRAAAPGAPARCRGEAARASCPTGPGQGAEEGEGATVKPRCGTICIVDLLSFLRGGGVRGCPVLFFLRTGNQLLLAVADGARVPGGGPGGSLA